MLYWRIMRPINSQQAVIAGRKGGKAPKRPYRYGIHDIAKASGKSVHAVRHDRQRGKFDPYSLESLVSYCISCHARK